MNIRLKTALTATILALALPAASNAAPQQNNDGSHTCNASSAQSGDPVPGVCAANREEFIGYCSGGLSTEPGGGVTCAPNPAANKGKRIRTNRVTVAN